MIQHTRKPGVPGVDSTHPPPSLVGRHPFMRHLLKRIATVGRHDCTLLICGESGSGKELVARHVHACSRRVTGPFVVADCTALPETLIASQLFGHVKGAFTDARQSTLGLVRAAHGGTLLIDEIGEMQLQTQAKLLRCIQEHSVLPVGAVDPIHVDVRIIAATHRDLTEEVARGRFREDLFYRLDVVRLEVPPLRNHRSDIPVLAGHFLGEQVASYGMPLKAFSNEAMAALESYSWPGNVRELRNTVERAMILSEGDYLTLGDLPERMRSSAKSQAPVSQVDRGVVQPLHVVERNLIKQALILTNGNQSRAAQLLEIERHRFARMIRRHGLRTLISSFRSSALPRSLAIDSQQEPQGPAPQGPAMIDGRSNHVRIAVG